jgi:MFS family permease
MSRGLVGAVVFAVAVAAFARIPLLPEIGRDLSLTVGEIGALTAAFGLGRLLTDLPAGRLAGSYAPSVALAGSAFTLAISCGLLAASSSLAQALLASALIGVASALTNTTGMYAFATQTTAARRGASMAIYTTALMSGQILGPVLGGTIGSLAGWREALAVSAAIGLAVACACAIWSRPGRGRRMLRVSTAEVPGESAGRPPPRLELIALAAAPFATFFGMAGLIQTLIPLIGDAELGLTTSTIGLAIGLGAAIRFVGAYVAGVASDRGSRRTVLVPSLLLMAAGAAILALPVTAPVWVASICLVALGSSGISVAAAAVGDRVPRERLGRELGLFRLVGDLGLLVGPIVAAVLYQASGPALAGVACAAVFATASLAVWLWVGEPAAG